MADSFRKYSISCIVCCLSLNGLVWYGAKLLREERTHYDGIMQSFVGNWVLEEHMNFDAMLKELGQ